MYVVGLTTALGASAHKSETSAKIGGEGGYRECSGGSL